MRIVKSIIHLSKKNIIFVITIQFVKGETILTDKCKKCDEDIFESGSISRCLKCGKATPNEISGKEYYEEKIKEVEKDHNELFGDRESLEKFAREKYLMKKETEDIYIVVEK